MRIRSTLKPLFAAMLVAVGAHSIQQASATSIYDEGYLNPTAGWRIKQDDFPQGGILDAVSFEWDYYMFHSYDRKFAGAMGYIVANPKGVLNDLVQALPNGGNVAFMGQKQGGPAIANFTNFGLGAEVGKTARTFYGVDPTTGQFGSMQPTANNGLHLTGRTEDFEWDIVVHGSQSERDVLRANPGTPFTLFHATDVGTRLPGEEWNVDNIWPRTEFTGTVKMVKTGEIIPVTGKGYREDSFGRMLLAADGWDFMVFSEDDPHGASIVFQTYHNSTKMDYMDVSFEENGQLVSQRFLADKRTLGWIHPQWKWDERAFQCQPQNTYIVGDNDQYRIEISVDIGSRQVPILYDKAIGTKIYFIQEHFPLVSGVIKRKDTGAVVRSFSGQAGGEFSLLKSSIRLGDFSCTLFNKYKFYNPLP